MLFFSLGGGLQSSVMLMRSLHGDIERPDHVIFSDPGWESRQVLCTIAWLENQCNKACLPFHRVYPYGRSGNIRTDMIEARTAASGDYSGEWVSMPLFVDTGTPTAGRLKRQCTREYKLNPIFRKQRELLGYKPRQRIPAALCQVMIGISVDEKHRASPSKKKWIDNIYPLIDPLKMTRMDCQKWWDDHYPHIPLVKSSCKGCPNRSDREWLKISLENPDEFEDACLFDEQIRNASGRRGKCYLHRSLTPLRFVDLNAAQNNIDLEDDLYCAGGCGI